MIRFIIKLIFSIIFLIVLGVVFFLFVGKTAPAEEINWGVVFSQKQSKLFGLDWRENYLAILDDLKVRDISVVAYWDYIEKEPGYYNFSDLDWQIREAEKREAKVMLVLGRKVPRWPECHIPKWAEELSIEEQEERVLKYIEQLVLNYRSSTSIVGWRVENEPFFPFGECPQPDGQFLKKEIELVKSLDDKNRPVVITESGEFPLWFKAARFGDVVGHTLYKKVWFKEINMYISYPLPSIFYSRKSWLIDKLFNKKVICTELQAEPWGPALLHNLPLEEQEKSMNPERFKNIIQFAQNTGGDTFYFWGVEWWYWLKIKHNQPEIWNEARALFDL